MPSGTVKIFFELKGYGYIQQDGGGPDLFVHISDVEGDGYRYLAEGEPVEFEIGSNEKGQKALSVRPVQGRIRGTVKKYEHLKGFGFIESSDAPDAFFHYSAILGHGVKSARVGENVEYTPTQDDKGRQAAKQVKRLDPRPSLFRFASFRDFGDALRNLAGLAERERWHFEGQDPETERPILSSYLIHTFDRLEFENKISQGSGMRPAACFNTGLVTPLQEQIYAVFEQGTGPASPAPFLFKAFRIESDRDLLSNFPRLPELANYFDDPSDLLYDRRRTLMMDHEHIIEDNISRFPQTLRTNKHIIRGLLENAQKDTEKRVYRNYKTAIPQFHRGDLQLLLPLCLEHKDRADVALVVSRVGEYYRGDTVLALDWAYKNARLITKPDTEWLDPSTIISSDEKRPQTS